MSVHIQSKSSVCVLQPLRYRGDNFSPLGYLDYQSDEKRIPLRDRDRLENDPHWVPGFLSRCSWMLSCSGVVMFVTASKCTSLLARHKKPYRHFQQFVLNFYKETVLQSLSFRSEMLSLEGRLFLAACRPLEENLVSL